MVALFSGSNNKVGCGFGIFFVYLYTTFYASSLDVTSYVYCAEIFPTYMRTTGMGVSIIGFFGAALGKSWSQYFPSFRPLILDNSLWTSRSNSIRDHWLALLSGLHHSPSSWSTNHLEVLPRD